MRKERAAGTIISITILIGVLLGGMNFAKFGTTLLVVTLAYFVLGMFVPFITWVVFLQPWQCAAIVFLGRPAGVEGPGGPVLLIPFVMWVKERVDLRDQSSSVGPFQHTTSDLVELAGVKGVFTHRIRQDEQGRVSRGNVEAWAFGTSPSARELVLRSLPEAVLRERVGEKTLKELVGAKVQIATDEIEDLVGQTGREVRSLVQGPIDMPDALRSAMARQVSHTAEAAGLNAIREVLATAQGEGVTDALNELRRSLALTEIESPIVIAGSGRRDGGENEIAGFIAALRKELGGER